MKLQSLAIIFIIIVFPMILILSYYISLQIDTITLYNKYNNELIDATNDAMSAFELNTANEELSSVSDSLRSIIDASTNTFINTLSTSLGLSNVNKHDIEPYIPSILYTMYDGYYIYAPTRTPVILEKTRTDAATGLITSEGAATVGGKIETSPTNIEYYWEDGSKHNDPPGYSDLYGSIIYERDTDDDGIRDAYGPGLDDGTMYKTDYVLKSYMPYSATYHQDVNGNEEIDPNESVATINYTLDNFMSISAQINGIYYTKSGYYIDTTLVENCSITNWENMSQDQLKDYCLNVSNGISIIVNGVTIEAIADDTSVVNEAKRKAITYYLTNTVFSNWVNTNLTWVTGDNLNNIIDSTGYSLDNIDEIFYDFSGEGPIFGLGEDPEDEDSVFNNHKYNIIKNSIQYNLNLAISSYSSMFEGLSFEMPQLPDEDWDDIIQKISIVTFMQGLDCGLKEFNGYARVSSTNNEMTVIPEEIYYVINSEFDGGPDDEYYYHRIDCENLRTDSGDLISFKSKEVKYDAVEINDTTAAYDHKNLACYDCIVQANYLNYDSDSDGIDDKKIKLRAFLGLENDRDFDEGIDYINTDALLSNLNDLKREYYIAIGKERQNQHKTTAYSKNEGIKTFNPSDDMSSLDFNTIEKFEITLQVNTLDYAQISDDVIINGDNSTKKSISTTTSNNQTIQINNNNYTGISSILCENSTPITILSIKVIFK